MRTPGPQSYAIKFTPVPVVATAVALSGANPGPQCVPTNPSRLGLLIFNQSAVVARVYLMPKESFVSGVSKPNFTLATTGYWEDIKNYVGDVIIEGASTDAGTVNVTEEI